MSLIRDWEWILTKYIRKMRFPRDLIYIRFTKLTLSNISYSVQRRSKIIHVISYWFNVSLNWQIRAKTKWLMFESVNLVKRMHIRSRENRIFRMYFVKIHFQSRISLLFQAIFGHSRPFSPGFIFPSPNITFHKLSVSHCGPTLKRFWGEKFILKIIVSP